ncbi:MAG: acetate--CoA ligase family protein [Hyphomicrobiaceae bacterium]
MSKTRDIGALLAPKSVAVIGAAPKGQGLRGRILEFMLLHPFAGKIYPVSRSHKELQGLVAYPSIGDCPGPVDLAVLIIPAQFVAQELEACGKAGVRAAAIVSSGFAEEPGEAGARMQAELKAIAQRYGMAVTGPNSEGFAAIETALLPTFSPVAGPSTIPLLPANRANGRVALVAQSGGMGFSFFDRGRPKEMAFDYIVTTGNEACLEGLEIVEYLLDEGKTDAFLMLIEDIKTPETFVRVAEKALRAGKPLIVNKIGKTDAGARAAASHTAALAGSYASFQALAQRYGVIEGAQVEEMVDIANGFMCWRGRLPKGGRVGICTGSGGGGAWLSDACMSAGLEVPTLDAATRAKLDPLLPSYGTSQNPVDGTAQAIRQIGYAGLAGPLAESPIIDGVICIMSARSAEGLTHEKDKLKILKEQATKPILMWSYTLPAAASVEVLSEAGFPLYTNMQNVVTTMRLMGEWNAHRERFLQTPNVRTTAGSAKETTAAALAKAGRVLSESASKPILQAYGLAVGAKEKLVTTRDEAVAVQKEIGGPVALKVQSPDILHKTEAGAVALGAATAEDVGSAYDRITASAKAYKADAKFEGVLVQAMAKKGREVILGVNRDPHFGPMLMLGLGGIHVEVLKDVAFAPVPVSRPEAEALIGRLKGAAILGPVRGQPAADKAALADMIVRLSELAADHKDTIAEIDLNPVIVHPEGEGATIADALIVKVKD